MNGLDRSVIEALLPDGSVCELSSSPAAHFRLLGEELAAAASMAPKRLREFRHGRQCARRALRRLGYSEHALPVGNRRAPAWPDGIVGSLAHHDDHAIAVAAPASVITAVGIDLISTQSFEPGLPDIIASPAELSAAARGIDHSVAANLIFSCKESIFKCVFPKLQRYIDFLEVEINFEHKPGHFSARPAGQFTAAEAEYLRELTGRYAVSDGLIATVAVIGPAPG